MANGHLEFCTVVDCCDDDEFAWFHRQLVEREPIEADRGDLGFDHRLDPGSRRVEFVGGESGDPDRLGELLHRFLERFRPGDSLPFTWAVVRDRACVDGFDGGAIVATSMGWAGTSGSEWARERTRRWEASGGEPWSNHGRFPRDDWTAEVAGGDTQLGYWDWVVEQFDEQRSTARTESHQPEHEGGQ